jgi:hypothetical protein
VRRLAVALVLIAVLFGGIYFGSRIFVNVPASCVEDVGQEVGETQSRESFLWFRYICAEY